MPPGDDKGSGGGDQADGERAHPRPRQAVPEEVVEGVSAWAGNGQGRGGYGQGGGKVDAAVGTATGRLAVAHEAVTDFGVGAELAAMVADKGFWTLDAPIRRIGAPFMPAPYAPNLERLWLPAAPRIADEVRQLALE